MPHPAPAHKSFADRNGLYQEITDRIIAEMSKAAGTVKLADSETEFGNNLASESAGWTLNWRLDGELAT